MPQNGRNNKYIAVLCVIVLATVIVLAVSAGAAYDKALVPDSFTNPKLNPDTFTSDQPQAEKFLCNISRGTEYRIGTSFMTGYDEGTNVDPVISGDTVAWREIDKGAVSGDFIRIFNITSRDWKRFPGTGLTYPAIDGNHVVYGDHDQIIVYDTISDKETRFSATGNGVVEKVAIAGSRVMYISSDQKGEKLVSHDLVTGAENTLKTYSGGEFGFSPYGLKMSGDKAVWIEYYFGKDAYSKQPSNSLTFPPEPKSTIVMFDFSKKEMRYLNNLIDPAINQTDPDVNGDYIVWLESRPDLDNFNYAKYTAVVVYDSRTKTVIDKIPEYDPGPPVISGNQIAWSGASGFITIYDLTLREEYSAFRAIPFQVRPPHFEHYEQNFRSNNILGMTDTYLVYPGPQAAGSAVWHNTDIYLYKNVKTPCLTAKMSVDPLDGYAPLTVTFDASGSISYTGGKIYYNWIFYQDGDASTATGAKTSQTFSTPGVVHTQLTVTDTNGFEANATQDIYILNPDEARITRDPNWSAVFPKIYGDFMCWREDYIGPWEYEAKVLNPELKNGTSRIIGYNIRTGERKALGINSDQCSVGDKYLATIGKEDLNLRGRDYELPDILTVYSLSDMKPVLSTEIGNGRSLTVSGSRVVWEQFIRKNLPDVVSLPWNSLKNPRQGIDYRARYGQILPTTSSDDENTIASRRANWQSDVMLLDLTSYVKGTKPQIINISSDEADSNWPEFNGNNIVWVDYSDPRFWPDKEPVLWRWDTVTRSRMKLPATAVQISPVVYDDRVLWFNDNAQSRNLCDTGNLWTRSLQEYNLTTGQHSTLRTFTSNEYISRLSLLSSRILLEEMLDQVVRYDPVTNKEIIVKTMKPGSGSTMGGFDQYCNLLAFSENRDSEVYNIYLKEIPKDAGEAVPNGCSPFSIKDAQKASKVQGGDVAIVSNFWWAPIHWLVDLFTPQSTTPSELPASEPVSHYVQAPGDEGGGSAQVVILPGVDKQDTGTKISGNEVSIVQIIPDSARPSGEGYVDANPKDKPAEPESQKGVRIDTATDNPPLSKVILIKTSCPAEYTACSGACVNLSADPANCGGCGNLCDNGGSCENGQCVLQISLRKTHIGNQPQTGPLTISCPAGSALCQAGCVDTMTDTLNCGSCNNACSSGYLCFLGECQPKCSGGQTFCNGACASLLTDPANCGTCGNACTNGGTCGNGQCVLPVVKIQPTGPGGYGIVRQHL